MTYQSVSFTWEGFPLSPRPKHPPPDRRQDILNAAFRVFSEKGFAGATNADIAKAAGVTAPALYYYFPSKEALFEAAISERRGTLLPVIQHLSTELADLPPRVVLETFIRNLVEFLTSERTLALLRIIITEGPRNPTVARIYEEQAINTIGPFIMNYLTRHMERGAIRSMPPQMLVLLAAGPIFTAVLTRDLLGLTITREITNAELTEELCRTVIPSLLADEE